MHKCGFTVYDWDSAVNGGFLKSEDLAACGAAGTALTVGGFDGMHKGHCALFDAVLSRDDLLPGIVTFAVSPRAVRHPAVFEGAVSTLEQRLHICKEKGFAFAVVIDFSGEFGKMEGSIFLSVLAERFFMKFLAEGPDFRCGYKGSMDIHAIRMFAEARSVSLSVIDPVVIDGGRVSSTRIRAAVCAGDFICAHRLLGRPFRLDCSDFDWKQTAPDIVGCSIQRKTLQVLPPDGIYKVQVVYTGAAGIKMIPAVLTLEHKYMTVKLPQPGIVPVVEAVDFTV